jgi:UDP-glucose 4-epimerase
MKKILVTGAAGFIGSHLCEKLVENYEVLGIDNLSLGNLKNIGSFLDNKNFQFFEIDILNRDMIEPTFRFYHYDTIFHLAANSDISKGDPRIDIDNTFNTTLVLLEQCRKHNIKEFVFASSSAIYGETEQLLTEDFGPLNPVSHYGAAKLASEAFVNSYCTNYGIKSWICRFPNVCGERATHGVILDFMEKIRKNPLQLDVLGDGNQIKPYIYVKELVDAMLFIWENAGEMLNIYNIGVNTRTTVREIAEMVVEEMGKYILIHYEFKDRGWMGDVPQFNFSTKKLKTLGWSPLLTSNEAVATAIRRMLYE